MAVYRGERKTPGGRFDIYVVLARDHNWTPEQVDRMDPRFIDELFAQKRAHADYLEDEADLTASERKARQRHRSIERKLDKMNRREKRGGK